MGSLNLSSTMQDWARYCDCLQSVTRFKVDHPISEASSQIESVQQEKKQEKLINQNKQKQSKKQSDKTVENNKASPQLKKPKHNEHFKNKNNDPIVFQKINKQDTQDEISDISQIQSKKENIFDIIRIQDDEDIIRANYNIPPVENNQFLLARVTAPSGGYRTFTNKKQKPQIQQFSIQSQKMPNKFFLNQSDKTQFAKDNNRKH